MKENNKQQVNVKTMMTRNKKLTGFVCVYKGKVSLLGLRMKPYTKDAPSDERSLKDVA